MCSIGANLLSFIHNCRVRPKEPGATGVFAGARFDFSPLGPFFSISPLLALLILMAAACVPGVGAAGILPPKGIGTRGKIKALSEENGLIKKYKSGIRIEDYVLMGGGDPGDKCGVQAITKIHPYGVSVGYEPLRCKRPECPNCAPYDIIQKVKAIAYKLECYARAHGDRPHAMVMSVKPEVAKTWDWNNFETSLFRRGYRRAQKLGVVGGVGICHPFRIKAGIKEMFNKEGVKDHFFAAAKKDVLKLGSWRDYVKFGYHEHSIGFPGYFDQHEDHEFVIKKYTVLEDLESVVKHLLYLIGHSGVVKTGSGTKDSIRWWGVLNGNSKIPDEYDEDGYCEDDLSLKERDKIRVEIEKILDGLDYLKKKEKRVTACPITGMPVENFFPAAMLPVLVNDRSWVESVCSYNGHEKGYALLEDLRKLIENKELAGDILLEDCLKNDLNTLKIFSLEIEGG